MLYGGDELCILDFVVGEYEILRNAKILPVSTQYHGFLKMSSTGWEMMGVNLLLSQMV